MWPGPASSDGRSVRIATWLLPLGILLYLAVFAWRFADERLYSDSGYYLARVINEGTFRIEHGRWVLALSQVLPLIGSKLGVPMSGLITLHSLNNVVWLGACLLFVGRVLRDRNAMIALAAVHLIGLTHGLFCPIYELYYGVDLLIIFHACYKSNRLSPSFRWIILTMCFVGAISSHFIAMVLAAGLLALDHAWRDRKLLLVLGGATVAFLVVHTMTLSVYEKSGLEFLLGFGDPGKLMDLFSPTRIAEFAVYLVIHYADTAIIAVAGAVMLWKDGQRWSMLVFITGLLILHILAVMFLPGFMHDRYREQVNFATTAWIVLVLCIRLVPVVHWRPVLLALLVGATLFRMGRAERAAAWYVDRTDLIETRVEQARSFGLTKGIVSAPVYFGPEHQVVDLSWSTSVESLLLSSKNGPTGTVSLITTQDLDLPEVRMHLDGFIFRRWDIMDPSWLNTRYFRAPTGTYVPLPPDQQP
ncbi:MAG: hypothetical protein IT226_01210 [Flavobacteriales bacterium]|nr:hypothetical protein [Flavobacteriales bacterium]